MNPLTPYMVWIKWGLVVVLFALAYRWAYGQGYDAAELKHLKAEQSLLDAAGERAQALQRRLDALPKAEESIREVVRNNPATCDRPVPVSDGLRKAIREANRARAVPADS